MKKTFLLFACVMVLWPLASIPAVAQDMSTPMSVPTTRLFGRILSRQHGLEQESASVLRSFVALFSADNFPEQVFNGEPPAVFYDFVPPGYVAKNATTYALIEPPFGGYNFKQIPLGNYWFCKFDIDDGMSEEQILSKPDLMLSGCQYLVADTIQPIQQNYYRDELGFWFDDFNSQPEDKPAVSPLPELSESAECAPTE